MIDAKTLNDIAQQLSDIIPADLKHVKDDLDKNFRSVLQTAFEKMDLVTREEFDAQVRVLTRTREKLEALEKQINKGK